MLSVVHSILDSYAIDAILSVFVSFSFCLIASKYFSRPTMHTGLLSAGPKFSRRVSAGFNKTCNPREKSTPPSSPEPESEPVDGSTAKPDWLHSNSYRLPSFPGQGTNAEPGESLLLPMKSETSRLKVCRGPSLGEATRENNHHTPCSASLLPPKQSGMHRDISPPKVLRWSYDAHVEDQKQNQRRGTFSPLAESLRPEIKFPPGLDPPSCHGWNEIFSSSAGSRLAAPATGIPKDQSSMTSSGSLRENLELLKKYDPECVLVVKKIKRFGFESPTVLKEHFDQYGVVLDVLVALTHSPQKSKSTRVRPAAMGYVVMEDAYAVKRALQAGLSQNISGVLIELRRFNSFNDHYGDDD